jgi:hypothetical protein
LAKEHGRSALTALREAHVSIGHLTSRAWEAKLSRNEAKTKKDRSLSLFAEWLQYFLNRSNSAFII